MKDTIRQISVIISVLATLVINGLANTLPLNGQTTGQVSDRFNVYFVPAGYVFSIWGLIYVGLIAYTIYQALPSHRMNPRLRATGWWIVLGGVSNSAWIFLWHYNQFTLTLIAMLILLATLILTYLKLGIGRTKVTAGEKWAVHLPISIYLGWITVATIANITDVLDFLKWDRFGITPEIWTSVMLGAVLVIAVLMNFTRRDVAYAAVLLWSLIGISVKHASVPAVAIPTWITFSLVAITLVIALFVHKPVQPKKAAA